MYATHSYTCEEQSINVYYTFIDLWVLVKYACNGNPWGTGVQKDRKDGYRLPRHIISNLQGQYPFYATNNPLVSLSHGNCYWRAIACSGNNSTISISWVRKYNLKKREKSKVNHSKTENIKVSRKNSYLKPNKRTLAVVPRAQEQRSWISIVIQSHL